MAFSKHAHFRYNLLDECFRNKNLTFKEVLNFVNEEIVEIYPDETISTRTLREDLKVFRDKINGFGAPLPVKARLLKYTNLEFSIAQKPLLPFEQYLVEAAQQLLERFEHHPKYNNLAEILLKFQEDEEQENNAEKILFYDQNDEYKGIKFLKPFYLAIKKEQVLQITFKGFQNNSTTNYEFHPQILKQYNRRWFVFGINKSQKINNWSIPLDERLTDINVIDGAEYESSKINWENYFRNLVGIVKPKESLIERVVLIFYNGREFYFKTKPFQPDFEEFFEEEKANQVWFDTFLNKELVQQILSYGQDVEVLEPEILRKELLKQTSLMHQFYLK